MVGNKYKGHILKVIDGDTFDALLKFLSFEFKVRIRLYGFDSPEKSTNEGKKAKQKVIELIEGKDVIVIEVGIEKYGRALASITMEDGTDLTEYLIEQKIGVEYHGEKRQKHFCSMQMILEK